MKGSADSSILVMAGEPSGDWAAGQVVSQIRQRSNCSFYGVGGEEMADAGVFLEGHIEGLAAMGFKEVTKRLFKWMEVWCRIRERIDRFPPKVALLVDSPEINLPLARILKAFGTKVVYFVGPQVWAWRSARLSLLRHRADVTALVLPFEKDLYDSAGARAVFVGHPVLDRKVTGSYESIRKELTVGDGERLIAFLPGSRLGEVKHHLNPMIQTVHRLAESGFRSVMVPAKPNLFRYAAGAFSKAGAIVVPPEFGARRVLRGSDAAVICSGTATLEAAVESIPHVVVYRTDGLSYSAGKRVVHVPFIGLTNLVAGRPIVPELIQNQVCSDRITDEILGLIRRQDRQEMVRELRRVAERLEGGGAATQVADLVLERLS